MSLLILLSLLLSTQAELIQVIQLARHGARTPNSFEFLPNQYLEDKGELTSLGLTQQYFLGQEMRKRYVESQKFLSEVFDESEVLFKSSWKNRTIWSALAFANGLFPQQSGTKHENVYAKDVPIDQLLPLKRRERVIAEDEIKEVVINKEWALRVVEIIEMEDDLHFHAVKDNNCPPAENIIEDLKKASHFNEMENYLKASLYDELAEEINLHLGKKLITADKLSIKKVKSILDNIRCNSFHGKSYPKMKESMMELLKLTRAFYAYNVTLVDDLVKAISGSQLLSEFHQFTKAIQEGEKTPKFIFYSAHDTTLEIFFSLFLLENKYIVEEQYNIIPFSSTLSIEIHKTDGSSGDAYHVKMFYNDEPQFIKWCLGYTCTLEQFHAILDKNIIPNLKEFCSIGKTKEALSIEECDTPTQSTVLA